MLYEIKNAKKFDAGKRVRWFSDDYFDLAVWFNKDGSIHSFQLAYDKFNNQHAITWRKGKGFLHEKVDDGETVGRHKQSPILLPDGKFPHTITSRFKKESANIDPVVREFIMSELSKYQ